MASVKKYQFTEKWHKPPSHLYEDNYKFGINFYQPMIDYLDDKKTKQKKHVHYPHLPWNNERGLEKYSKKLHKSNSEENLYKLALEAEEQAKYDLENITIRKHRSNFGLSKSASAASLTRHMAALDLDTLFQDKAKREASVFNYKSAKAIETQILTSSMKNLLEIDGKTEIRQRRAQSCTYDLKEKKKSSKIDDANKIISPLNQLKKELKGFDQKSAHYFEEKSKQTSIEIEQLSARVVEAETRLKTEVTRIKKKLQIQITELEMSLDVANKNNIELQKTVKKQSLQITELQAHYDEVQRQLQVTLDQYGIAQRRLQSLTGELEEIRGNYEAALRGKRAVEQQYEESVSRINELTTINVNLASAKSKIEQELATLAGDYDEISRELRVSDERYQRVQVELKHTVELVHEEQERIVKIEAIKKSLEIEVKNLSVRLEEVEANAIVGGKRIISKLEARLRDVELELDEEKRRHAETIKILRKKERTVKEVIIQSEEDQKNVQILQESLDKASQKLNLYKRQLQEQEGMSAQSVTRVRRFQRELEAAEDRADTAESNLSLIRAKHRTFVTTSSVPGSQVYLVQETHRTTTTTEGI